MSIKFLTGAFAETDGDAGCARPAQEAGSPNRGTGLLHQDRAPQRRKKQL
jgi:hypothetical protein